MVNTTFSKKVFWPILTGTLALLLIAQLISIGSSTADIAHGQLNDDHPEAVVVVEHIDDSDEPAHQNFVASWSILDPAHSPRSRVRKLNDQSPPVRPPNT